MSHARALSTRQLVRRMQARGHRLSTAKLDELLRESEEMGIVERVAGGWRIADPDLAWWLDRLPQFPSHEVEREAVAA